MQQQQQLVLSVNGIGCLVGSYCNLQDDWGEAFSEAACDEMDETTVGEAAKMATAAYTFYKIGS